MLAVAHLLVTVADSLTVDRHAIETIAKSCDMKERTLNSLCRVPK